MTDFLQKAFNLQAERTAVAFGRIVQSITEMELALRVEEMRMLEQAMPASGGVQLNKKNFEAFRQEFLGRFAGMPIRVFVKNEHWRPAYEGRRMHHAGVERASEDLAYVHMGGLRNGLFTVDHNLNHIIMREECKYAFFTDHFMPRGEQGLYIDCSYEGRTRKLMVMPR